MINISAQHLTYRQINELLRAPQPDCDYTITDCCGQRFLATGMADKRIALHGIPGNALGAYLNGAQLTVWGNAQDAVGDTMNAGSIIVHGNIGDAAGYAMRGGQILVQGDAGYRAGIHMKAYRDKIPVMVIGGTAGSFLGEYQAGGIILVLGLQAGNRPIVGNFPCTGMHGGSMFLRGDCSGISFPAQVHTAPATKEQLQQITPYIQAFCNAFGHAPAELLDAPFTVVTPNSNNPYKQMYAAN